LLKPEKQFMNILEQIVNTSRRNLEAMKKARPLEQIQKKSMEQNLPLNLAAALRGSRIQLVAEVKKASPSKGVICNDFHPVEIAKIYAENGAAAISVLTEVDHFQGSLDYLKDIDMALGRRVQPLIRKDFILDPYQVYESRAFGADALLLIVAILDPATLQTLLELSHQLNLSCLVETHNEEEVGIAVASGARIIGINNRDLDTFEVDIATTQRLRPLIPPDRIVVSESGIKTRNDIEAMKSWGVDAILVGETLMASQDIASRMKELL
jgi:indole-3-glycerol phosphate synthase